MHERRVGLATGLSYNILEWPATGAAAEHTVILLHGFLDVAWSWQPTVAAGLEGRAHIVAPDMRGHGDSDRVGSGGYYHFLDYLADLHSLIEELAAPTVSLVGHSMGGTIAGYYAGAYPDRLHRAALLEGLGPPSSDETIVSRVPAWIRAWGAASSRKSSGYDSVSAAAARLRANDPHLEPAMAEFLADKATRKGPDGRLRFKHDPLHLSVGPIPFRTSTATEFWRRIRCPVLLMEGENSRLKLSDQQRALREGAFSQVRRVAVAGAGHMMIRHQPEQIARELASFLFESA